MQHTILIVNTPSHLEKYDLSVIRQDSGVRLILLLGSNYQGVISKTLTDMFDATYFMEVNVRDGRPRLEMKSVPQGLLRILEEANAQGKVSVVSTNSDYLSICADLREFFNLKGRRLAEVGRFINKAKAKQCVAAAGLLVPRGRTCSIEELSKQYATYEALTAEFGADVVLKPLEAAGCVGVMRIKSKDDYRSWQEAVKIADSLEVEEFITGDLYHFDALLWEGEVIAKWAWRYAYPNLDFVHGRPLGAIALTHPSNIRERLISFGDSALKALGATEGFIHMEVFHSNDDNLVFLEVGPRPPGLVSFRAYLNVFGFNYVQADLLLSIGVLPNLAAMSPNHGFWMAWPQIPGVVVGFETIELPMSSDLQKFLAEGDTSVTPTSLRQRACQLDAYGTDYQLAEQEFKRLRTAPNPLKVAF